MLETADRLVIEEREPSVQQFLLLVGGLRAMTAGEHGPGQVLDSYLLRSLAVAGYAPSFEHCARCGRCPPPGGARTGGSTRRWAACSARPAGSPGSASPAPETVALLGGAARR